MTNEDVNVDTSEEIEKIIIINKNGSEDHVEKGMVIDYKDLGDAHDVSMRFHKMSKYEIFQTLHGIGNMFKQKGEMKND